MPLAAVAGRSSIRVAGIFSDMTYNQEGGDVLGTEVWLTPSASGWYAVVQFGEGEPSVPVVVPAQVRGTHVTFELPESLGSRRFEGDVTPQGLVGKLGKEQIRLRRGKSYWQ